MLLPALKNAKEYAKSSSCLNNLRQIGTSFNMYIMDFEEYLPPINWGPSWDQPIFRTYYTNILSNVGYLPVKTWRWEDNGDVRTGVWRCPSVEENQMSWGGGYSITEPKYPLPPQPLHGPSWGYPKKITCRSNLSTWLLVYDGWLKNTYLTYHCVTCPKCDSGSTRELGWRHNHTGNGFFVDGHAQNIPLNSWRNGDDNMFNHY